MIWMIHIFRDLIDKYTMNLFSFLRKRRISLINPRLKTLEDLADFVDLDSQPALSIVTRAHYRAKDMCQARQYLGETPILNAIKSMESQGLSPHDQLRRIHGLDILGNMYTQHPDRLIPFWLRCKEMNLTQLLLNMLSFSDHPPLSLRPIITQCYMDIVRNLNDIDEGVQLDDNVESSTEAEFVAFRRSKDIEIHGDFLETAFKIWAARMMQLNDASTVNDDRSTFIKRLMVDDKRLQDLSRQFWMVDALKLPSLHRSYIWHDTDTCITNHTPATFIHSIVNQLYYGARLISHYLPKTGFDIDPSFPELDVPSKESIQQLLHECNDYCPEGLISTSSPYKNLQRALITLNDHIKHAKYKPHTIEELRCHCEKIRLSQDISYLLASINPDRYGKIGHLIHQLHIYLSVTARVRESDVLNMNQSLEGNKRQKIIQDCFEIWRLVSTVSPVHLTIADFGSIDSETCLRHAHAIKPSEASIIFALPERSQDTQGLIHLLKSRPQAIKYELDSMGVLLGKSDAIKRTRAPFYTLALNLSLGRLVSKNKRYIGNGSSIIRGGTLTHLTWANLGHTLGYGKTVQQGDSFRSSVNEYHELSLRAEPHCHPVSIFETIALAVGPSSPEVMSEYQHNIAMAIAEGALEAYPNEASRSHFKFETTQAQYEHIMSNTDASVRINQIKSEILPNLRAIPEANIAISQDLYPFQTDAEVSKWYHCLIINHQKELLHFYANKAPLTIEMPDPMIEILSQHRDSLSSNDLTIILGEINGSYVPPVRQFAIDMVSDTLRQIHPKAIVRGHYETIFKELHLNQTVAIPTYINIGSPCSLLATRAI